MIGACDHGIRGLGRPEPADPAVARPSFVPNLQHGAENMQRRAAERHSGVARGAVSGMFPLVSRGVCGSQRSDGGQLAVSFRTTRGELGQTSQRLAHRIGRLIREPGKNDLPLDQALEVRL